MEAYCLSERTKVLVSNASLDNRAEVTRLLVMMRALVEANRVQGHLGYCGTLQTFVITLSQTLLSANVCHTPSVHLKGRGIQVSG